MDEPYTYSNGQQVNNWDFRYIGATPLRYAIEHSMNVCAVRTLTEVVTPELGYQYLLDFGFTTLVDGTDENYPGKSDIVQSTALGGITRGVYNLEMTLPRMLPSRTAENTLSQSCTHRSWIMTAMYSWTIQRLTHARFSKTPLLISSRALWRTL